MNERRFEGVFEPPDIALSRRYARMAGPGAVVADAEGLRFEGRAYDLTVPNIARAKAALGLAAVITAAWALPVGAQGLAFAGAALLAVWAARLAWNDRRGWPIDARIPWRHVDAARADDRLIAIYIGEGIVMGSPVPSPAVFVPAEGHAELLALLQSGMEAHPQPENLEVV
jgi:hypothetical protein